MPHQDIVPLFSLDSVSNEVGFRGISEMSGQTVDRRVKGGGGPSAAIGRSAGITTDLEDIT